MGRAFEVRKVAMAKTAAAKSKVYAKYGREIYMAAKSGTPDPELNVNLKRIIEKAKKDQVSSDVIKRAIDKAKGGSDENYSEIRYEGFGPGNSMLIIDCLTDNVNRTIAEVRTAFNKAGGKIGVSGSVLHQFDHHSLFSVKGTEDEVLEALLENNVDISDLEVEDDDTVTIYGAPTDYANIKDALTQKNLEVLEDEITFLPMMSTTLTEEEYQKFERLVNTLDELDDVSNVYHNVTLSE